MFKTRDFASFIKYVEEERTTTANAADTDNESGGLCSGLAWTFAAPTFEIILIAQVWSRYMFMGVGERRVPVQKGGKSRTITLCYSTDSNS